MFILSIYSIQPTFNGQAMASRMCPALLNLFDVHWDIETPSRLLYNHASMHCQHNEQRFSLMCVRSLWDRHSSCGTGSKIVLIWAGWLGNQLSTPPLVGAQEGLMYKCLSGLYLQRYTMTVCRILEERNNSLTLETYFTQNLSVTYTHTQWTLATIGYIFFRKLYQHLNIF